MCQIWVQWWDFLTATGYCWFEVISLQKHGQLIIQSLSYTSMACATKVLLEVPADLKILNIYLYTIDALLESAHFDYKTIFLGSHEISQYLLRSPKIFWGIIRSTEISSINWFDILHLILIHDTWHLTLICFWHWYAVTFDNWYLTSMQNLSDCIVVSRTILMLLIALYCTHCRSLSEYFNHEHAFSNPVISAAL
jgi:hypothetical protein